MKNSSWFLTLMLSAVLLLAGLVVGERPAAAQEAGLEEQIFGSQIMTYGERMEYRNRLRAAETEEERQRIRSEHHERMLQRARERHMDLPEAVPAEPGRGLRRDDPPGKGIGRETPPGRGRGPEGEGPPGRGGRYGR